MKIQTQARLLIAGIVVAPLLIVLINVIYRFFPPFDDAFELPNYKDISVLFDEKAGTWDWKTPARLEAYSRHLGEVVVFRDDFFVLYSTNQEFSAGVFVTGESIQTLLNMETLSYTYIFFSQNIEGRKVYFLIKTTPQQTRSGLLPLFAPALRIFIFIFILVIFVVCMSIVITKTITHSVQVLENASRRIAEGELDLQINVKGSNEITSLTNSLNKLRNALKEEEIKRARFIMGITHDLKTPLALIKGYAEAIEDGVAEDPVARSGAAEIIADKADQLEGMINDLTDFVRMDSGKWREQLDEINLTGFLRNVVKTLSMDVELLHHKLISDIVLSEDLFIPMDERLVHRALENLIHNAVRYTPSGATIHLRAVCAENSVELTISDNGPGIDKEDLPYVFEMFYRGSSSRREQGMGLGLAVVKWVVDYHGWSISVASEKGKGACFSIAIPLIQ